MFEARKTRQHFTYKRGKILPKCIALAKEQARQPHHFSFFFLFNTPSLLLSLNRWSFIIIKKEYEMKKKGERETRKRMLGKSRLAEIFFKITCPFCGALRFVSRRTDTALSIIHGIVYFPTDAIIPLWMTACLNSIFLSTGTRIS